MASTTTAKPRHRRILQLLLFVGGALVLYYLAMWAPLPYLRPWWGDAETRASDGWHRRSRIASGMVLSGSLVGKSRATVTAQLGTPFVSEFGEPALIYGLDSPRDLLMLRSRWLVLQLDSNETVTSAAITEPLGPLPFLQTWWRHGEEHWLDKDYRRHRVADRLVRSGSLLGKSRAEVLAALGPPSTTGKLRDWSLIYSLGVERSWMAIDSEWLALQVDAFDRVREARILSD